LSADLLHCFVFRVEARGGGLNLSCLLSDRCRLSFSCVLQFLHDLTLFEHLAHRDWRIRRDGAELAVRIDDNRQTTGCRCTKDAADEACYVKRVTDTDRVVFVSTRGNAPADVDIERALDARTC